MSKIDIRNQRLDTYTQEVQEISSKIESLAEHKSVNINYGVDTPSSLIDKINANTVPYEELKNMINGLGV